MKAKKFKSNIIGVILLTVALLMNGIPVIASGESTSSYTAVVTEATSVYSDEACTEEAGSLGEYDVVTVTGINNTIARIRYGGYTLYTNASVLTDIKELEIPATVTTSTFVFEDASITSRSLALKAGTQVNVIATAGQWAMIEYKGYVGYTYKGYLETVSDTSDTEETSDTTETATDTTDETAEETTDPFEVTEKTLTSLDTTNSTSKVTKETVSATVKVSKLPVYKSASTRSDKLGTLTLGTAVTVYAYNTTWAYIGKDGKYGFCALKGLKKDTAAESTTATTDTTALSTTVDASTTSKATVKSGKLTVYSTASTSSKVLGTLSAGIEVNVIKTSSKWAYIELDGNYGFCLISGLTSSESVETPSSTTTSTTVIDGTTSLGTCTVITATAPLYASASTTASYTTVAMGTTYDFYKYTSKWVTVNVNGKAGYIPRKYLNADTYADLSKDDSSSAVTTLNTALLTLGYLDDVVSSNFNAQTESAVNRFQTACGMSATGEADQATLRVLYSGNAPASPILSVSLSSGDSGDNVTRLQTRLFALGYFSKSSSIDGSYGTTTTNAVKLFQTAAGGTATGKADSTTIKALYHPKAPTMPSSSDAADASTTVSTSSGGSTATTTSISSSLASTTSSYSSGMSNAQKLEYVIYVAQQQLGKRYVYGSSGLATFDCSGLTMYAFGKIGISLPHSAYSQGYNNNYTKLSTTSSMRRGDLIFFNTVSDSDMCDHVGIYLGNYYFLHASSGAGKVVVSNVSSGYYSRVFSWGRRILG